MKMMMLSTSPPTYPARSPNKSPIAVAISPARRPIFNEDFAAATSSVKTSRPKLSVPRRKVFVVTSLMFT